MAGIVKTQAMRILDRIHVSYIVHTYESDSAVDGISVAAKLGLSQDKVFKTLVVQGNSGQLAVFIISVGTELDLKKCAQILGEKKVEMLPLKELTQRTGYVRGGCSPLGMKKSYRTYLDISALHHETILVSGGRIGLQLEIDPKNLAIASQAEFEEFTLDKK